MLGRAGILFVASMGGEEVGVNGEENVEDRTSNIEVKKA